MTLLLFQAKHAAEGGASWGVDGETGALCDMTTLGIWEPLAVKAQTYKTAVEVRPVPYLCRVTPAGAADVVFLLDLTFF